MFPCLWIDSLCWKAPKHRKHTVILVLCDQMNAVGIKHLTGMPATWDGKQRQRAGSFQTTETQPQLIKTSVSTVLLDVQLLKKYVQSSTIKFNGEKFKTFLLYIVVYENKGVKKWRWISPIFRCLHVYSHTLITLKYMFWDVLQLLKDNLIRL